MEFNTPHLMMFPVHVVACLRAHKLKNVTDKHLNFHKIIPRTSNNRKDFGGVNRHVSRCCERIWTELSVIVYFESALLFPPGRRPLSYSVSRSITKTTENTVSVECVIAYLQYFGLWISSSRKKKSTCFKVRTKATETLCVLIQRAEALSQWKSISDI